MAISIVTSRYWDVNSSPQTVDALEVSDFDALKNTILNIFKCKFGDRGALFLPDWGNLAYRLLHEPIDDLTAAQLRLIMLDDIRRGSQPFVSIDIGGTTITPIYAQGSTGYKVTISLNTTPYLSVAKSFSFNILR